MTVNIKLFAGAREIAGCDVLVIELAAGATFGDLRHRLVRTTPPMAAVCRRALFAADARYVDDAELVPIASEIALIPPVSGG